MPAGNDADAAVAELADKFGIGDARAEDLVSMSRERYPREMRKAMLKPKDKAATAALDLGKAAKAVDVPAKSVTGASVRGDYVIVRYKDKTGRVHKRGAPAKDAGVKSSEKS